MRSPRASIVCELTYDCKVLDPKGQYIESAYVRPSKRGKGYYVSFYYNHYRHWADHAFPGLFIAVETRDPSCYLDGCMRGRNSYIRGQKAAWRNFNKALRKM